jgi:primosomal protein N' (replication factor Y)
MTRQKLFAQVAFPIPLDRLFTYEVPDALLELAQKGRRVLAPFGNKKITGYVVRLDQDSAIPDCHAISEVLDSVPVFSDELLHLAQWISEYYMAPLGQVLHGMLPPGLERESEKHYTLKQAIGEFEISALKRSKPLQAKILKALFVYKKLSLKKLAKKVGSAQLAKNIQELERLGIVKPFEEIKDAEISIRFEKFVRLADALVDDPERIPLILESLQKKSPKQAGLLEYLSHGLNGSLTGESDMEISQSHLLQMADATLPALKALVDKKYALIVEKEKFRNPHDGTYEIPKSIRLNKEQSTAVELISESIRKNEYQTFLLHGITGSGKTQVYIESIKNILGAGKTAIVLVPEISLTPQAVERFKSHFGNDVTVLHSRMSLGERFDSWRKLHNGDFKIVIGARSAVFAPLKNLGLIVVDEEHENTYRQNDAVPRYHARDVAVVRANLNGAVVILGSATPGLESYYNAKAGKYQLLELTKRIEDVPLPEVEVIDMRKEKELHTENWQPVLSKPLRDRIRTALRNRQQIILFQNRRGYASFIQCYDCGFAAECPHCSITLTYHMHQNKLRCHYCGYSQPAYRVCPKCENTNVLNHGVGTQKVEEQLKEIFRDARVERMDLDTTTAKGSHGKMLEKFKTNETQILLGTQMVTKGLDFENVTVVGVISADTSLLLPDFRSSERTFQLLTQVAGRAGRKNKLGHVIIQTLHPERSAIVFAQKHDYIAFYAEEIEHRRELMYPPFGRLMLIQLKSEEEKKVVDQSYRFCDILRREVKERKWSTDAIEILGPVAAPILKIRNAWRWHILLKVSKSFDKSGATTRELIRTVLNEYQSGPRDPKIQIQIEADPYSLL